MWLFESNEEPFARKLIKRCKAMAFWLMSYITHMLRDRSIIGISCLLQKLLAFQQCFKIWNGSLDWQITAQIRKVIENGFWPF